MHTIQVLGKNAWEAPFSILFCAIALLDSLVAPRSFIDALFIGGSQLVAFLCALNAVLDFRRFGMSGRTALIMWFTLMLVWTPMVLWDVATIEEFGFK